MGTIWFEHPAEKWEEALPIGNGRLGAMIFGGMQQERIALNQDSIWYGGPVDRVNPDAKENLPKVRSLLLEGRIPEAEELLRLAFSGTPQSERPYQPLGNLEIVYENAQIQKGQEIQEVQSKGAGAKASDFLKEDNSSDSYRRELDLADGIVREHCRESRQEIQKEYFASCPHSVIAIRLRALQGSLTLKARLDRKRFFSHAGKLDESSIYMDGSLGEDGISWMAAVRAVAKGGECCVIGEHLMIRDAEEVFLYIGCETSFYKKDFKQLLTHRLDAACEDGYEEVKRQHLTDYQALFGRVSLQLGREVDERSIERQFKDGKENGFSPSFAALYFQYGRYLLMASSRPGSLPATLQGIWNEAMEPAWDSKYTININTEMNYWPAEVCSLTECHLPLFDHILRMWENGRHVAREMYGCRGFVAHHNTDIWGDCAPQDIYVPATYWVMGAAWLCTHIWWHYLYTGDEAFLQKMYPVMEDAVLFFHDYLIEVDGKLMTCPSVSPENTYILPSGARGCMGAGASMDNEILRDLLEGYLKASAVLGVETKQVQETKVILGKLPGLRIGKYGQIMEWREDYEEQEPGHRHISQLYALHPSRQITPDKTPELAKAAEETLKRRLVYGGGHTGWSCAWIVNFYTRLYDGDRALEYLNKLWRESTFCNMMDNHPLGGGHVFQIDGNLGATAAIAEMLVQSDEETIRLLPALPGQWKDGSVKGLTTAYGVKIDLSWEEGEIAECIAFSPKTMEMEFRYHSVVKICKLEAGQSCKVF